MRHLVKAFFQWKIQVVLLLMLNYILTIIYLLARLGIWNFSQIKNTVIWTLSVAFLSLFQIEVIKKDCKFFKHIVLDNLKLVAIIEFIIGVYSFSLLTELIMLSILTLIRLMAFYLDKDLKHKAVHILLNGFWSMFGLFLIVRAVYNIVIDYKTLFNGGVYYDFALPPLLTLLYLPFIFSLMAYVINIALPRFIENKKKRVLPQSLLWGFLMFG